ncbi:hypothetical protein DPMN_081649 [Dreissena polymorpha]|uniref:Uncharacterized protein n=1 Tax=Dreissena polymorpha TaxID=45954 RepID=A0A9D4BGQ3_DREPO|nr:hypothetical protein DPMN_081649 [Dreissena polymorpha]
MVSMSLSRMFRAANLPSICALNASDVSGSFSFFKYNLMRGFYVTRLFFNFSLMVVSTKLWSQKTSAPGNVLEFAIDAELEPSLRQYE